MSDFALERLVRRVSDSYPSRGRGVVRDAALAHHPRVSAASYER
jgi:hypothetical protein